MPIKGIVLGGWKVGLLAGNYWGKLTRSGQPDLIVDATHDPPKIPLP